MKSAPRGKNTSAVEVTNVSSSGFWLLLGAEEVFVEFKKFPWFKDATIGQLLNVERPAPHHLYWPALDVDLAVESLSQPERFPLVSRVRPNNAFQRAHSRVTPRAGRTHGSRRAARR
jgi:hypothetical protein